MYAIRSYYDTHAEGEALILVRVDAAIAQHVRMHHARSENLHPAVAGADLDRLALAGVFHVHLGRRLRERKEVRAEAGFHIVDLEEGFHEIDQAALQVPHMGALLDDET